MTAPLTTRDRISMLTAQGVNASAIARQLGIGESTVRHHRAKLGIAQATKPPAPVPKAPDPNKRTVICKSTGEIRENRVQMPRMPWENAEGTLADRPETRPMTGNYMVSTGPETTQAERTIAMLRGMVNEMRGQA